MRILRRLYFLLHRDRLERELAEEMDAHRDMLPPARRAAFGNLAHLHDETRDVWGGLWLDHLGHDLRYAARGFTRDRRFTLSAVAAIALAVGAATAVFSVVDRSLFRPLPYAHGARLVTIGMSIPLLGPGEFMFNAAFRDWRVSQSALDLTAWQGVKPCDLGGDTPERLNCAAAEDTFLPTLGVAPALGHNFSARDDTPGAPPVALISHAFWRTHFAADPNVLSRTITIDGAPTNIIGVLPANFETPDLATTDLLIPQKIPQGPNTRNYEMIALGRLRPNETPASAAAALAGPFERFRADFNARVGSDFAKTMRLQIEPLRDRQVRQYRLSLWVLLGAVTAFVLIACANVANLLLARSSARRQEFAMRAALGASRGRLASQLLTESAVLATVGGVAGCALASALLRTAIALAPEGILRLQQARLDARVLVFALLLSLVTAILFGFAPIPSLKLRPTRIRGRQVLIAGQLAVSLVLLSGAGLLLLSLWHLENVPLGFRRERVITATFTLPAFRYGTDLQRTGWSVREFQFFHDLEARLWDVPGTVAAAITDSLPPGPAIRTVPYVALANPGGRPTDPGMSGSIKWRFVTPAYFEALGIPITRGRAFTASHQRNAVIDASLARRLFGDNDPIGKRVGARFVIGVAASTRNAGLDRPSDPEFYILRGPSGEGIPGSGDDTWWRRGTAILRTNLPDREAIELLRNAIRQIDPSVPVQIATMQQQVDRYLTRPRFHSTLLAAFALTGLLLAAIGLYGLMSYLVAERTREIGIRMALGATPRAVSIMFIGDGARWVAAGIVTGLAASAASLRVLSGLLFSVNPLDPRVLVAAISVLAAIAILASWLPAHRAARTDPMIALRHD